MWYLFSLIVVLLIMQIFTKTIEGLENKEDLDCLKNKDCEKRYYNKLLELKSAPSTCLQGKPGPRGPIGASGGSFQQQGYLRSLSNLDLKLDRLFGQGLSAQPFLNKSNYRSNQMWMLDDILTNKYNGCLVSDASNILYISANCSKSNKDHIWNYDKQGRLINNNLCLTANARCKGSFESQISNFNKKDNIVPTNCVELSKCDDTFPDSQQWTFY